MKFCSRNYQVPCKNCGEYTHNDFCSTSCGSEYVSIYGEEKFPERKYCPIKAKQAFKKLYEAYEASEKKRTQNERKRS